MKILSSNGEIVSTPPGFPLEDLEEIAKQMYGEGNYTLVSDDYSPEPEPEPLIPLTQRQIRLALLQIGILDQVRPKLEEVFDGDPRKQAALIEWDYASEIEVSNPLVELLRSSFGMTEEEKENLWRIAQTL